MAPTVRSGAVLAMAGVLLLGWSHPAQSQRKGTENGEWRYWGGDEGSSRYSPLDQVNAENVANLEVVWRWKAANYGPAPDFIYRATPLKVGDKLFTVAGQRRAVVAIDPATGETLWMWRMKTNPRWEASTRKNYGKSVAYADVDGRGVVYLITPGYYLVALDAGAESFVWIVKSVIVILRVARVAGIRPSLRSCPSVGWIPCTGGHRQLRST